MNCDICLNSCKTECKNFKTDKVQYHQHKYVRGDLLPAICQAMGETSEQYVHDFLMKPKWLHETYGQAFFEYKEYSDIPTKYQRSAKVWKLDNGNFACIPSMSNFTQKETKSYIEFLENYLGWLTNGMDKR